MDYRWVNEAGMTNRQLMNQYEGGRNEAQRVNALWEMARRVGTFRAMTQKQYHDDEAFRQSVDRDTVQYFTTYKLQGAGDQRW